MNRRLHIQFSNVILGRLSSALDLVTWLVMNHHRQVTCFAVRIAVEMSMRDEDRSNLAVAAALQRDRPSHPGADPYRY